VSGTSQTMQMTMKKVDGNGTGYSAIPSGTLSTSGWTQLAGQYALEVSDTLTERTLYFEVPISTNAAFYGDDRRVEVVGSGDAEGEGQSTINRQEVHQRIDGFGASSAWTSRRRPHVQFAERPGRFDAKPNKRCSLSWRPPVSQAGSTNVITIAVADDGTRILAATNSSTITVDRLSQPELSSIAAAGDRVSILASGPRSPDYTVLASMDLANWQPLLTTSPATMPFTLTNTNAGEAARFHRLQLGP
jgi:hypothetical protein